MKLARVQSIYPGRAQTPFVAQTDPWHLQLLKTHKLSLGGSLEVELHDLRPDDVIFCL